MNLQNPLGTKPETMLKSSPAASRAEPAHESQHAIEPAYKAVIHCLSDMDDLLDTVHDPASFAVVKPQLLSRAKQHAAQASEYPNQGMTQLSRSAAMEMQKAANRHTGVARACDSSRPRSPRIFRDRHRHDPEPKIADQILRARDGCNKRAENYRDSRIDFVRNATPFGELFTVGR